MDFEPSPKRGRGAFVPPSDSTVDVVQEAVLQAAKEVTEVLQAAYDTAVFADAVTHKTCQILAEAEPGTILERNMLVPIEACGRVLGLIKVPFAFTNPQGRALLLLEVKTKRTALKESDLEDLGCAVEQIARVSGGVSRPRAMVLNFSKEASSSLILQEDGTVTASVDQ